MDLEARKAAQRRAGKAARRALTPQQRATASAVICAALAEQPAFVCAGTIFVYRALPEEADCAALCRAAAARGCRVAYPYCPQPGRMEAYQPIILPEPESTAAGTAWQPDCYGILSPVPAVSTPILPAEIDLVLVPLTAFDAQGGRVGMGGGLYDRFLPLCRHAVKIGVAFDMQKVPLAACGPWDAPLDMVVTEAAIYRAAGR
ncbi:MAG: 5-formyltetrahydrofolate cyclo-ligase [Faecalibacterium sp.]|jgi:5-formyltetrahydrofolate cyclo-ligase|nr:5-formyltetrahydrofolate cyclo-ligase [Faecalibacterium sp.]